MIKLLSNLEHIESYVWQNLAMDTISAIFTASLIICYYKLKQFYKPIREIIGVLLAASQIIYTMESSFYLKPKANMFLLFFISNCLGLTIIFYDTVPTMFKSFVYMMVYFGYSIGSVKFRKIENELAILTMNEELRYMGGVFLISIEGLYCLLSHRYDNLINKLGISKSYKFCLKVLNACNLGISIENGTNIFYRNAKCKELASSLSNIDKDSHHQIISSENSKVEITSHTLIMNRKQCKLLLLKDITSVVKNEQERYFQMLVASITHELRTPLNIMIAILNNLLDLHKEQDARSDIIKALCAASMQEVLINDILDLAKINHGVLKLNLGNVNVKSLLNDLYELYKYKISKEIHFDLVVKDIPEILLIDEKRYKQVLLNLLSNSSKFTFRGSIIISVSYRNGFLYTIVQDTGIGIDPKEKGKIFKEFGIIESAANINKQGTGLGLNLCYKLVQKMGGKITFESTPIIKTEFQFSVKADIVEPSIVITNELTCKISNISSRVMLVDDNPLNTAILEQFCKKYNKMSVSYTSSLEALKQVTKLENGSICLIDLNMPQMNGYELAQKIKEQSKSLILYAITGEDRDTVLQKCTICGFSDVIEKPISYEVFKSLFK